MTIRIPKEKIRETITLNAQSGDLYAIKFLDQTLTYVGIPVPSPADDRKFRFRIIAPAAKEGIAEFDIDAIETMEKQ